MKRLKYILIAAVISLMAPSCSDNATVEPAVPDIAETSETITVKASVKVDDMGQVTSRAMGDTPGEGLTVNVFEFQLGATPASSFYMRRYPATVTSATTAVDNGVEVHFTFTLNKAAEPRTLQFVVSDHEITTDYGSGAEIMQSMSTSGSSPAYWGRLEFPEGYCDRVINPVNNEVTFEPKKDLKKSFKAIPLIRNFAKVSVSVLQTITDFELTGFELINVPSAGTVAPWNIADGKIPQLLQNKAMRPYADANKIYKGIVSPSAKFTNTEAEAKTWPEGSHFTSKEPQYLYEHPYEPARRTYLIVAGRYQNGPVSYYKIDLGAADGETTVFTNYDILRNYHYAVTINAVRAAGYATVAAAVDGFVSNNLSASTETRNLKQLSDGTDMIGVNSTRFVVTKDGTELTFKCSYLENINQGEGTLALDDLKFYGLEAGSVIESVNPTKPAVQNDSLVCTIRTKAPTTTQQEQTFEVVGRNGLARIITLLSHTPWKISNIETYNVLPESADTDDTVRPDREPQDISPEQGAALTIFFDLPDGMNEAWFPLEFTIEADRQNIENNSAANSTLVVSTGQSLFTGVNDSRVRYIKTVTYDQYRYNSDKNNVVDVNSPNVSHTVRCRFRTTVSLKNLPDNPQTTTTTVHIANPYFDMGKTTFIRKQGNN